MFLQQGDVLVTSVNNIPVNASKLNPDKLRGWVLAEGEATGHAHTIAEVEAVEMYEQGGVYFLCAKADVPVRHQEHGVITIPKGNWKVGIVKEYDYDAEEIRSVRD